MTRCLWKGCERLIPDTLTCCHLHWFRIPTALRTDLWLTSHKGEDSPEYVRAKNAIQEWMTKMEPQ